jgi:hypothetical protein
VRVQETRRRKLSTIGYVEFPATDRVEVGDRVMPTWVDVVMPGDGDQPRLTLRLEVVDKVPQCRQVTITSSEGGREVRPADLKAVHVTEILEEVFAMLAGRVVDEGGRTVIVEEWGERAQSEAVQQIAAARKGRHARSVTPGFLQEVAEVYRSNIKGNPTQAVQTAFSVSKRMASEYVKRAREAGLLPPTTPGKKHA